MFRPGQLSPLRHPGGKGKVADFVQQLVEQNDIMDGYYVEPYAGGGAVALELLLRGIVHRVALNDISVHIHSFWRSVLEQPDELCALVQSTPLDVDSWDRQKAIVKKACEDDFLATGFATLFLNRTNRSGILNGGPIGGRDQTGNWLIDARYNVDALDSKIQIIAQYSSHIDLTKIDAVDFLRNGANIWPDNTLVYLYPPYFHKGRDLYYHSYVASDHLDVFDSLAHLKKQKWLVSYDDCAEIREIYFDLPTLSYQLGHTARSFRSGSEVMFFKPGIKIPLPGRSMKNPCLEPIKSHS
ncbi:MAG: DNA adenine methylase [Pseudomonadota bacterium]